MTTHTNGDSSASSYPDAEYVGSHLLIDKAEWVPGEHPEPHRREEGQRCYVESYYYCLRCGEERLRKRDFPAECDRIGGDST